MIGETVSHPNYGCHIFDSMNAILGDINGDSIKSVEAIVYSMTPGERRNPDILNGSRRRRIALGSGTSAQQVNQLLNQFRQMKKMMKQMSSGKMPGGMP